MTPAKPAKTPIALIYWGRLGAGAALMHQISSALAEDERFEVYASPSLRSELAVDAAGVHLLPIETFSGWASLAAGTLMLPVRVNRLVRQLSAAGVKAIVTIMPHVWGRALQRAAARAGMKTLLIVHDAEPHLGERRPLFDWLVTREVRACTRIVTFSDHVADRLIARGDATEERLGRLYHPIFHFTNGAALAAHPAQPFRLLFFGRILPYKGVPILLDAFARLRAAGVDCTLRVVGRGEIDSPPSLMSQPGLSIETGWVAPDAIGGILASADAVVLPYLEASQSGVIAAAYGAGLPVVATPVGGLIEQISDGETGTLANAATADALADAIRRLIETPDLYDLCRKGVAQYAAAHAPRNFAATLGDTILATITER
ncbi:MAG TPA: glycosyltransferase family 4 protein [Alphaproteobacteria bacterium]|nr:glycosyltransferase family 4 protein [Alphaproteobacteria bacterium]